MGKLAAHARFFSPLPRGFLANTSCAHYYRSIVASRKYATNLPAQVDLLERYRGLVALGQLQADEEQIRVIAQVCLAVGRYVRCADIVRRLLAATAEQGLRRICTAGGPGASSQPDSCAANAGRDPMVDCR